MDDIEEALSGVDVPTALPPHLRAALTEALSEEPLLAGLDAPRPLPPHVRSRLEQRLARRHRAFPTRWLAVAAAIVLLAGTATVLSRGRAGHTPSIVSATSGLAAGPGSTQPPAGGAASQAQAPSVAGPTGNSTSNSTGTGTGGSAANAPTAGGASGTGAAAQGGAPPFASPPVAALPLPASDSGATPGPTTPPPPGAPLTIAIVGGDPTEEAGFDAYVALLNQQGGINYHRVDVVKTTPSHPVPGAVATVNLSDAPVTVAGPRLENLAVQDAILRGDVFDTSSAPVHQAVAAVNVVFPAKAPGAVAVVYRGAQGVWATDVPDAMVAALRARGVTPLVVPYAAGQQVAASPAGVAFLALDTADAKAWFAAAGRAGYHPAVVGIGSLVEPSLAANMPDGTRAVAPYTLGAPGEHDALAAGIGTQPGMGAVHGWVTAKVLAVALWRTHATTPAETAAAIANLGPYDDGFAPPLMYRPGTNSRVPDGIVFTVHGHQLVSSGGFVRDPAN